MAQWRFKKYFFFKLYINLPIGRASVQFNHWCNSSLKWPWMEHQRSWKGVYWFHIVCPSVDRIVSALYLQQYSSDPFHICTSYQATSEVCRVEILFQNSHILANSLKLYLWLCLLLTWEPIWLNSKGNHEALRGILLVVLVSVWCCSIFQLTFINMINPILAHC